MFWDTLQELVAFSLVVSLMGNLCSHTSFYQYFRFFSGIILVLILLKPVSFFVNSDLDFEQILQNNLKIYDKGSLEEELAIADETTKKRMGEKYKINLKEEIEESLREIGYRTQVELELQEGEDAYGAVKKLRLWVLGKEEQIMKEEGEVTDINGAQEAYGQEEELLIEEVEEISIGWEEDKTEEKKKEAAGGEKKDRKEIADFLYDKYRILSTQIVWEGDV